MTEPLFYYDNAGQTSSSSNASMKMGRLVIATDQDVERLGWRGQWRWSAWARCTIEGDDTIYFLAVNARRKKNAVAQLERQIGDLSLGVGR